MCRVGIVRRQQLMELVLGRFAVGSGHGDVQPCGPQPVGSDRHEQRGRRTSTMAEIVNSGKDQFAARQLAQFHCWMIRGAPGVVAGGQRADAQTPDFSR